MNPLDLLKNLNIEELKKKSDEMVSRLKEITVTGEAGSGFVKVTINGEFTIISIEYEDNDFIRNDIPTFRDLIILAQNDAVAKMRQEIQRKFSTNLIPGLFWWMK